MSIVDLFRIGNSCLNLLLAFRRMYDIWVLYLSLESSVTPSLPDSYGVSLTLYMKMIFVRHRKHTLVLHGLLRI
jgi:hypothetical protein